MKILLIEGDKKRAHKIKFALKKQFLFDLAENTEDGVFMAETGEYGVIVIDSHHLDTTVTELCQRLRKNGIHSPILVLSPSDDIETKIMTFDAGADDFLSTPFNTQELQAHIKVLSRRSQTKQISNVIAVEDLSMDTLHKTVIRSNKSIQLRRKEFEMLELFMRNKGKVVTRQMLLNHVWVHSYESCTNTIDVHVKYLRDRIDKPFDKKLIKTIYGFGYKLEA